MKRVAAFVLLAVTLTACRSISSARSAPLPSSTQETSVTPSSNRPPLSKWRNVIRFGGIMYWGTDWTEDSALTQDHLGPAFARVRADVAEPGPGLEDTLRDGDATGLPPGTVVYTVKGYQPTFRLAAHAYGRLYLYQAAIDHQAQTGGDLLDIADNVQSIRIEQMETRNSTVTQTGKIADPAKLVEVANMVQHAPVVGSTAGHSSQWPTLYAITFSFKDGTVVQYFYWPDNRKANYAEVPPVSASGLLLPKEFQAAIEEALRH